MLLFFQFLPRSKVNTGYRTAGVQAEPPNAANKGSEVLSGCTSYLTLAVIVESQPASGHGVGVAVAREGVEGQSAVHSALVVHKNLMDVRPGMQAQQATFRRANGAAASRGNRCTAAGDLYQVCWTQEIVKHNNM